jgi:phenylalanyl-tRNA synthetase alpha subunit
MVGKVLSGTLCGLCQTRVSTASALFVQNHIQLHDFSRLCKLLVPNRWRYDWSIGEAKKNLLRTHTTAVSSRMLYALAQQEVFTPKKYFSIDRVFRNESIDATHLAEFHQIEGVVADRNLSLCDLIGVITAFFHRLGALVYAFNFFSPLSVLSCFHRML